jgi:hypothetical protein
MVKGKAIEWSDEEIAKLVDVTPADVERARVWWLANAPKEAREILDAEPINDATETV